MNGTDKIVLFSQLNKKLETYRSGHNGAHSKCVCPPGHEGSNPSVSVSEKRNPLTVEFRFFIMAQIRARMRIRPYESKFFLLNLLYAIFLQFTIGMCFLCRLSQEGNEVIQMNYEKIIKDTLDSFGVHRSYTGYNYVTYGLLLILENKDRMDCITKLLYPDIASFFHTSWNCVEKNIRTVVNSIWDSQNTELLNIIFNKSAKDKKPANKEFFKYMYDYIVKISDDALISECRICIRCPISNQYCETLNLFCKKLLDSMK